MPGLYIQYWRNGRGGGKKKVKESAWPTSLGWLGADRVLPVCLVVRLVSHSDGKGRPGVCSCGPGPVPSPPPLGEQRGYVNNNTNLASNEKSERLKDEGRQSAFCELRKKILVGQSEDETERIGRVQSFRLPRSGVISWRKPEGSEGTCGGQRESLWRRSFYSFIVIFFCFLFFVSSYFPAACEILHTKNKKYTRDMQRRRYSSDCVYNWKNAIHCVPPYNRPNGHPSFDVFPENDDGDRASLSIFLLYCYHDNRPAMV